MADLKGVEIFGEGVWNGNVITSDVLKNIVTAFDATNGFIKPVLKLGHNEEQTLLQKDGFPAAGWVSNVYIRGKKLIADFVDIPEKIYELIKRKAYRKVSVEIFNGYRFDGRSYPNLLGAVALLGADTPAVMTLSDILDRYKLEAQKFATDSSSDKIDINIYSSDISIDNEEVQGYRVMSQDEREKMQEMIDKMKSQIEDLKNRIDEMSKEKKTSDESYSVYKKEAEEKIIRLEKEKEETEIEKFSLSLQNKNLISPSMQPYLKAIASKTDKQEFSIGSDKLSSYQVIEKLLTVAKEVFSINKEEKTQDVEPKVKDTEKEIDKKIEEYMQENKVSYSAAYRAVVKSAAI